MNALDVRRPAQMIAKQGAKAIALPVATISARIAQWDAMGAVTRYVRMTVREAAQEAAAAAEEAALIIAADAVDPVMDIALGAITNALLHANSRVLDARAVALAGIPAEMGAKHHAAILVPEPAQMDAKASVAVVQPTVQVIARLIAETLVLILVMEKQQRQYFKGGIKNEISA